MSWPSLLTIIELHAPICNGQPSYINNPPVAKLLAPVCTSECLSNSTNLSTCNEDNLLLSSPKTWWQGSSHSWDNHFFNKSDKVEQLSSFPLSYAMTIHLASISTNGKVPHLHMQLKTLVRIRKFEHMWQRELALDNFILVIPFIWVLNSRHGEVTQ